ncbi:MAG: relaxase/mobilization nuclease domain-containing protein, partial [Cyclobacteriaceae bacterium]
EKGRAERLLDTTCSQNKEQRAARILNVANANSSKKLKNKFAHISISFAKGENVSPEQQRQIADKYLLDMGYWNCPRILYQHSDTKNNHFHIVTTTVDTDGKKVNDFNDHRRSQELSREIEKQFGLLVTEYSNQESNKLQEINARKFKLLKGLEKLEGNLVAQQQLTNILSPDQLNRIKKEKLPDTEISKMFQLRDTQDKSIGQLYRIIRQYDAEYKTDKDKLRERLSYIKELSSSREEFMNKIIEQGLYVRKIAKADNVYSYTYGLPETNFYVNDRDLPIALRYDYLFTDKKVTLVYDEQSQKRFLKTMITKALTKSTTLSEFENNLKQSGINYDYATNARGVYGVSFSSNNLKEGIVFKGSEVGISWNQISKQLSIPQTQKQKKSIGSVAAKENMPHIPKGVGRSLDTSNDDEEQKKKRKSRDQDMDRD